MNIYMANVYGILQTGSNLCHEIIHDYYLSDYSEDKFNIKNIPAYLLDILMTLTDEEERAEVIKLMVLLKYCGLDGTITIDKQALNSKTSVLHREIEDEYDQRYQKRLRAKVMKLKRSVATSLATYIN